MRHGKKINSLSRKSAHRKAMLANMTVSLIMHKRINTTVAKAKALKKYVEPLLTKSKTDSTHSRRVVFSYLQDKTAINELFREISQKIADRPGGYTRILRTGFRAGDAAEMCIIELVDYNENYTQSKSDKKAKTKTTRRSRSKKTTEKEILEATTPSTPASEDTITENENVATEKVVAEKVVAEEVVIEEAVKEKVVEEEGVTEDTPKIETSTEKE